MDSSNYTRKNQRESTKGAEDYWFDSYSHSQTSNLSKDEETIDQQNLSIAIQLSPEESLRTEGLLKEGGEGRRAVNVRHVEGGVLLTRFRAEPSQHDWDDAEAREHGWDDAEAREHGWDDAEAQKHGWDDAEAQKHDWYATDSRIDSVDHCRSFGCSKDDEDVDGDGEYARRLQAEEEILSTDRDLAMQLQQDMEMAEKASVEPASFTDKLWRHGTSLANRRTTPSRECIVCYDAFPFDSFPNLARCVHHAHVCKTCYEKWIESELEVKGWKRVSCPDPECKEVLSHAEVQEHADREVYERFNNLATRDALNEDSSFEWCRGPGCKSGQIHVGDSANPLFDCDECGFRVCLRHDMRYHEGEDCEEYDYRMSRDRDGRRLTHQAKSTKPRERRPYTRLWTRREHIAEEKARRIKEEEAREQASRSKVERTSKKCPGRGCSYSIQKSYGCNHMMCSKCGYEFCWRCLVRWQDIRKYGDSAYDRGCEGYMWGRPVAHNNVPGYFDEDPDEYDDGPDDYNEDPQYFDDVR